MELTKYKSNQVLAHIRHDLRQLPHGKSYGNESVDPALSHLNYSLIDRGKTAAEVNQSRKAFMKQVFRYNRSNLVHAVELVIQCPGDCHEDQHEAFFQTVFSWYTDTYLVTKDCVLIAEVHRDEHKYITEIKDGKKVRKDISKDHLHLMYIPAIDAGQKHPEFPYRLNADFLTKKNVLRGMHSSCQVALDKAGIQATVYKKRKNNGKSRTRTISLSVQELKAITDQTGIVIDHSLTVEELGQILSKNIELTDTLKHLQAKYEKLYSNALKLKTNAEHIISQQNRQLSEVVNQNKQLKKELLSVQEQLHTEKIHEEPKGVEWGSDSAWGSSGWKNNAPNKKHTIEEEINL